MNEDIRNAIKTRLREQGITQSDLAQKVKIHRVHLTKMLGGFSGHLPLGWQKVLDALGLELVVRPKNHAKSTSKT